MGPFTTYYLNVYDHAGEKKLFLSWNWTCFFLSFFELEFLWFFYRRMYGLAVLFLCGHSFFTLIGLKLGLFFSHLFGPIAVRVCLWVFRLLFTFGFSVSANALYLNFIQNLINRGVKKKGVDLLTPFLAVGIFAIFILKSNFLRDPQVLALINQFSGRV